MLLDYQFLSYDHQNYSDVNPETLEYQDWEEISLAVWAALRPCREATGKSHNSYANKDVRWVQPKKRNPDCGFEVLTSNGIIGRKVFATVALNIVGDDFEIFIQRRHHDLVSIFSTRDDGPILSPSARLKAAAGKMLELTTLFDKWSREGTLDRNFPAEWIGTRAGQLIRSAIANRFISYPWRGASWRGLIAAVLKELVLDEAVSVEQRSRRLMRERSWSRQPATILSTGISTLFMMGSTYISGTLFIFVFATASTWSFSELSEKFGISFKAILALATPSELPNFLAWVMAVIQGPLYLLFFPLLVYWLIGMVIVAARHATALWTHFDNFVGRLLISGLMGTICYIFVWLFIQINGASK